MTELGENWECCHSQRPGVCAQYLGRVDYIARIGGTGQKETHAFSK